MISKEKKKAYNKAYYEAHKEREKARIKAYNAAHKKEIRDYNQAYHQAHKEEINEKRRKRNGSKERIAEKTYLLADKATDEIRKISLGELAKELGKPLNDVNKMMVNAVEVLGCYIVEE